MNNCEFKNQKDPTGCGKEAINIDTPDKTHESVTAPWSSYDCTADEDVYISRCAFNNVNRAIGTHNYSYGHAHKKIHIIACTIEDTKSDAIETMNWNDSEIKLCVIRDVAYGDDDGVQRAILAPGTRRLVIQRNTFSKMSRVAQFYPYCDNGDAAIYPYEPASYIAGNTYYDVDEDFIRMVSSIDFDDDESKSFNSRIDWGAYDTVDINN